MPRKAITIQDKIIKTLLLDCPHCGVPIARHLVYPDEEECVYTQNEDWLSDNRELDTKSLLIRKEDENA